MKESLLKEKNLISQQSMRQAQIIDRFLRRLSIKGNREKAEILLEKALKVCAMRMIADNAPSADNASNANLLSEYSHVNSVGSTRKALNRNRWERVTLAPFASSVNLMRLTQMRYTQTQGRNLKAKSLSEAHSMMQHKLHKYTPLLLAIEKVKPYTKVVGIRIAGTAYRVPKALTESSALSYSIRWIVLNAKKRSEKSMPAKLAAEILEINSDLLSNASIKQRDEFHKLAETNRAFIS